MSLTQTIHLPVAAAPNADQLAQANAWLAESTAVQPSWIAMCTHTDDRDAIARAAQQFIARCEHVVVCGTGGSSLSARALMNLVAHPMGLAQTGRPQLHLLDSTEPEFLEAALALPATTTGWLFISRSGGTLETLVQFLAFLNRGAHRSAPYVQVITLPTDNPLRRLALAHGIAVMDHATPIGGRYAVFSNVGMLPAAILGMDVGALRAGGAAWLGDDGIAMALAAAHWHIACARGGYRTHVMLPYCSRLYGWTYWYRQLWAESLGKSGKGTTPLIGLGPLDQHSMLQLLLDGPKDKSITTVQLAPSGTTTPRNRPLDATLAPADSSLAFLNDLSGEAVVQAQACGTTQSFINHTIPVRELHLANLGEASVGALFMQHMLETVFTAKLLGVNAFDQPAVEESKTIAMRYLRATLNVAEA